VAVLLLVVGTFAWETSAADRLSHVEPGKIKLGGELGRRIDVTVENNLLVIDVQKDFLQPFVARKATGGYIGLGKLIDSLVHAAVCTGDPRVLERKKQVVAAALATQEPNGYLGLMMPESRVWQLWDTHEMAYLIYGLSSDYRLCGEQTSLEGARKIADFIIAEAKAHSDRKLVECNIATHMGTTGLFPALLTLSDLTGDPKYRQFCVEHCKLAEWNQPIVCGRWAGIEGHAYAFIDHAMAQAQLCHLQPDEKLLGQLHKALDFLTKQNGLVITGTCGDHECWHDTQQGTINLGETCATAYVIRLMDDCLRREGDARYGDLMERAIYNALFAAQSPDGRRIRYYSPFDGPRTYYSDDTYCCPCNYRRIVAELPELVYYRSEGGLAVNLYAVSTAQVKLDAAQLTIRQETDYPNSGRVAILLDPSQPAEFPLRLRIPRWCERATVTVNGKPVDAAAEKGTFLTLNRQWKAGDRVELDMPMPWRLVKGRVAQAGRVAVMRGPMVFCLRRSGNEKLKDIDLRLVTIDPTSLEGPVADDSVRPGGMACRVKAWGPGVWYPFSERDLELTLTEFADPAGEATYFNVPDPKAKDLVEDELVE
jgi:DUF1680 family protein